MISVDTAKNISAVTGWIYAFLWSACMYPQPILNWRRQSVEGLSLEFCAYNFFGFGCYTAYTLAFYYWDVVQEEYNIRHSATKNMVVIQDVIFAVHCWVFTVITLIQVEMYRKRDHRLSRVGQLICGIVIVVAVVSAVWSRFDTKHRTYDVVNMMGYLKIAMSCIKYIPQVYINWQNKSTDGWSVWNVLRDLSGGVLSITQLGLDSWIDVSNSNTPDITWLQRFLNGNETKLGLASMCMAYDIVLIWQHYVLYRGMSPLSCRESYNDRDKPERKEIDL